MDVKVLLVKLIKTQTFLGGYIYYEKDNYCFIISSRFRSSCGNGHADASEAQVNKAELAQLAQSNDQSLNDSPIQEGAYNVTFDYEGFTYHFESDGTNWAGTMHNQVKLLNNKM